MHEVKPKGTTAFFYTDGGVTPNPGPAGSGVHGYVFSKPDPKPLIIANHFEAFKPKPKGRENDPVPKATMTDHGYRPCDKEGKVQGQFPWVRPEFFLDIVASFSDWETNNVAELHAVLLALQAAHEVEGLTKLYLAMDSQYALDAVSHNADVWKDRGWITSTGSPVANVARIQDMVAARDSLKAKGVQIEYVKIKAHTDDIGNNCADYLATIGKKWSGAMDVKTDVSWSIGGKRYWDNEIERHPMLHARRFIYNRKIEGVEPETVFMIEPAGTDLTIGKRDHEGYAVVRLKEPCPAYVALLNAQGSYNQDTDWPMNLKTDRLYNKFVQHWLLKYGASSLTPHKSGSGLYFLDAGNVAMEHNPPALIYRAMDIYGVLTERLDEYEQLLNHNGENNFTDESWLGMSGVDITHHFYEMVDKKQGKETIQVKQLKPEIIVGYQQHFVEIEIQVPGRSVQRKLPITLGMDLPPRNSLKKLETENPSVTLITWRSSANSFQYACVVECDSGMGIWSNFYCDRYFV